MPSLSSEDLLLLLGILLHPVAQAIEKDIYMSFIYIYKIYMFFSVCRRSSQADTAQDSVQYTVQ